LSVQELSVQVVSVQVVSVAAGSVLALEYDAHTARVRTPGVRASMVPDAGVTVN